MITHFRNFAKSKWAGGLFALIILSFLVVGAQSDIFASLGPRHIISAGDRSVDSMQFRNDFERVRANLQEQAGRPVSYDDMVKENLHVQYLESQTQRLGFLDWAYKAGIRPGKELVLAQIRKIPAFFNQITGQFDQELYAQALAQQNLTSQMLEDDLRDQYVTAHVGSAVFAGLQAPRVYAALLAGQALESRDGRWFSVTQDMAGRAGAPTDAQLTAFMKENEARLRSPEFRMISLVLFTPGPNDPRPAITEEQIQERYEFRKAALADPEKRTFVTLTVPTKEAADKIAADLRAGKNPSEVAKANNIQLGDYKGTPQAAVGDPAVGAAVFALAADQVSAPIQGRLGFTVAKVASIQAGQAVTLESARPALVQELQAEAVKAATYAKVEQFEKARQEGKNLADAATAAKARVIQLPPFTQQGQLPDGQPMNAPRQVLESAYALTKGGESDVIDAGDGQYFAVRLDDIRPSALPTLDEVRAPLGQQWTLRENARLLSAKAEQLAGRVRAGEDIAKVAAEAGAPLTVRTGVQQSRESQAQVGDGVLRGLFGQSKGQVFSDAQSQTAFVVGRVDAIHAATPVLAAPLAEQARPRLTEELANTLADRTIAAAALRTKSRNDPALALQALGVEAAAAAPAAPAAPAPAKK
ncbi:peptidylprolyl isomerase [Brevundimonas phoenicis]|uniref:peptidylprolyl isomerase n=1 Tax=unclassified Brevundimonas TaxID=2622653 RepID=UPI0039A30237